MSNVLFVIPRAKELNGSPYFGYPGVLSIASYIKTLGHNVLIEDRTLKYESFRKLLMSFKPDIVGLTLSSCVVIDDAVKISKLTHKNNIPVLWGGYGPIAFPEVILKEIYVDFVACGEGEYILRDLLNALTNNGSVTNIPGLAYKNNRGEILVNPMAPPIDLNELPVLDYSMINPSNYRSPFYTCKNMIFMLDGKGCPYQCKFCANKFFSKCKPRSRNMDDVTSEMSSLFYDYGFDGFFFTRELFAATKKELYKKCDKLAILDDDIKWGAGLRTDLFSLEDYEYMYKCGCRWLIFGVESGSQNVIENMKKNTDVNTAKQCIADCYKAGILPYASFVIGFLGETEEDLKKTVSFIQKIFPLAKIGCNFFSPVFCSESYDDLVNLGKIKKPTNLKDMSVSMYYKLVDNYSSVRTVDLKVIYYNFIFTSIFSKKNYPEKNHNNMFSESFNLFTNNLFKFGFSYWIRMLYFYFQFGIKVLYYTLAFPRIRKKYKLRFKMN